MTTYGTRIIDEWQNGEVIDIHKEMMRLSLAVISKTIFDTDVESDSDTIGKSLSDLLALFPRMVFPVLRVSGTNSRYPVTENSTRPLIT